MGLLYEPPQLIGGGSCSQRLLWGLYPQYRFLKSKHYLCWQHSQVFGRAKKTGGWMGVVRNIRALKEVNLSKMFTTVAKLLYFRLTWNRRDLDYVPAGLELIQIMPGIDIQKDIVNAGGARFIIPQHPVPSVAPEVVSGYGFLLKFE